MEVRMSPASLSFEEVEREIRWRNFGVLSTLLPDGRPHSVSVLYAVTPSGMPFALYVLTDRRSRKARNVNANPSVSFAIPLPRRLLPFVPPNSIQFQGTAEIMPLQDETAREAYTRSFVLRKVLSLEEAQRRGVFVRIRPEPVVFTYGVGHLTLSPVHLSQRDDDFSRLPVPEHAEPQRLARPRLQELPRNLGRGGDRGAIDGRYDVSVKNVDGLVQHNLALASAEPGALGRRARSHLLNEDSLPLRESEQLGQLERYGRARDAESRAVRMAHANEVRQDTLGHIDRYGEADVLRPGHDRRGDADHLRAGVEQGPTTASRVDGGVSLDQRLLKLERLKGLGLGPGQRSLERAHHAHGEGVM